MLRLNGNAFYCLVIAACIGLSVGTSLVARAQVTQDPDQATPVPTPPPSQVQVSEHLLAKLCDTPPVHIELSYQGVITEFTGPICYHFAGYNETCFDLDARWLTPATVIQLIAPGQVPVELLTNYTLLVRLPSQSKQTYSYALEQGRCLIAN